MGLGEGGRGRMGVVCVCVCDGWVGGGHVCLVASPGAPAALLGRGLDQTRHRSSMDCVYLTLVMVSGGGILLSPNAITEDQCKHVLSGSVPPARRESIRASCPTG